MQEGDLRREEDLKTKRSPGVSPAPRTIKCYYCGKKKHMKKQCFKWKKDKKEGKEEASEQKGKSIVMIKGIQLRKVMPVMMMFLSHLLWMYTLCLEVILQI